MTLTVAAGQAGGTLVVTPAALEFTMTAGGAPPAFQNLQVTSTGAPLNWTARADVNWIQLSRNSGTTPSTIAVSIVNAGQLAAGVLKGNITITTNPSVNVAVTLTIDAAPAAPSLAVNPAALSFNMPQGGANPPTQTVQVTSTGAALTWTAAANVSWLALVPNNGTTPATINVSVVQTQGLTARVLNGTITLTSPGAASSPLELPVTLTIGPPSTVPLQFTAPAVLPPATVGRPYEYSFCQGARKNEPCGGNLNPATNPTGGSPPYHFQLDSGVGFPPFGLVLDVNGLLSGIPTAVTQPARQFRVCAVDLVGTQACANTSLEVKPADPITGQWRGTFTVDPHPICRGTYTWQANLTLSGQTVTGSWTDSYHNQTLSLSGTFDGTKLKLEFRTDEGPFNVEVTISGTRANGTFSAPSCSGVGRITGTIEGTKTE